MCRVAQTAREKLVREGLLEIVSRAALADKELLVQRLRVEGVRLGSLTVGRAGHLGKLFLSLKRSLTQFPITGVQSKFLTNREQTTNLGIADSSDCQSMTVILIGISRLPAPRCQFTYVPT
jgi:hypothetical protein